VSRATIRGLRLTGTPTNKAQFFGLTLTGKRVYKARFNGLSLVSSGTGKYKAKFYGLTLTRFLGPMRAEFYGLTLLREAPLVVDAGPDQVVEPGVLVILYGGNSTGGGTFSWAQVPNGAPTVTFDTTTGPVVKFLSPFAPAGCNVQVRLTIVAGSATLTDDVIVSVRPQLSWTLRSGVWVPVIRRLLP
jgi:hypothetical protein